MVNGASKIDACAVVTSNECFHIAIYLPRIHPGEIICSICIQAPGLTPLRLKTLYLLDGVTGVLVVYGDSVIVSVFVEAPPPSNARWWGFNKN